MKKLSILGLAALSVLLLGACSSNGSESSASSSEVKTSETSKTAESTSVSSSTLESSSSTLPGEGKDYATAAEAEAALNAGEDLTGATVTITVDDFEPASAFGYNIMTGEHLNFVSPQNPNVEVGQTLKVKITSITSTLGSFIINYEKI